jgi:hypothetical protein
MAEKPADKPQGAPKQALDLNTLSGLDFGPSWADENAKRPSLKQYESRGGDSRGKKRPSGGGGAGGGQRDRRANGGGRPAGTGFGGAPTGAAPAGGGGERRRDDRRGERGGERRPERRPEREFFEPTIKVDIYPQDETFEALVKRLRSTVRTYQLFEIAHLLLEKPERFVVVVENKAKGGEKPQPLYFSVPGHLPFETEEAAINHVMANHLDLFFDVEEIEVEPPKGNFQMVNRCTVTGELLGPPNYHRYQEFLQRHYAARISGMSFDRFVSKVESVKGQESIDSWLDSMKKGARYTVKDRQEGELETVESLEAARFFLLQYRKDKVVGSAETIRFAGRDIERLQPGDIRRSVEAYVEQQLHFPLDSANNIRGRLRRHKFAVYKKGSKGVSFVCAVKRRFRDSKTVFTDSIRGLIEFIEQHPNTSASKLPKLYINIDTERQQPEKLKMTEAEIAAAAAAQELAKAAALAAAEAGEASEVTSGDAVAAEESAPAADASASTEATPKAELSEDEQKRLNQLMLDLRWLIVEGYVTEYGDGSLYTAAPLPEAKKEAPKKAETVVAAPAVETPAPVAEPKLSVEKAPEVEAVIAPVAEAELPVEKAPAVEAVVAPVAEPVPEVVEEKALAPIVEAEAPAPEADEQEPKA